MANFPNLWNLSNRSKFFVKCQADGLPWYHLFKWNFHFPTTFVISIIKLPKGYLSYGQRNLFQFDLYSNGIYRFYTSPTWTGFSCRTIQIRMQNIHLSMKNMQELLNLIFVKIGWYWGRMNCARQIPSPRHKFWSDIWGCSGLGGDAF